jgi:hypothetical protein
MKGNASINLTLLSLSMIPFHIYGAIIRLHMTYKYCAAGIRFNLFYEIFDPVIFYDTRNMPSIAIVSNLHAVKDQGQWPVCSAVTALTMYEQLLLREGHAPALYPLSKEIEIPAVKYGWAWIYLSGGQKIQELQKETTQ